MAKVAHESLVNANVGLARKFLSMSLCAEDPYLAGAYEKKWQRLYSLLMGYGILTSIGFGQT